MRVHVPKRQLADALAQVERIIPNRSSNPGLSLLQLELTEGKLVFSGSNMELDIQANLAADVEGQGRFALPAQVFGQVVRALPGELVELAFNENELEIRSGSYTTKLQLANGEGAPELAFPQTFGGQLDGAVLSAALSHVRYAAAVAEYQAIFRGVKLELKDNRLRAVATDGFRLAYYHLETSSGLDADIVLPARSVDELTRLLAGEETALGLQDNQLSLSSGPFKLNLKLMEGTFPDYERVIPSAFPVTVTLDAKALEGAVSRVALVADKTTNNRVDLFIKDGNIRITAEGGYGRSEEALGVAQEGSESEIALAYNAKYLVDALSPVEGDLRFSFSGPTTPSVMSSLKDPAYLAMVVPLRTG